MESRCGREFGQIYELMKLRIFNIKTKRFQLRIHSTLRTFCIMPKNVDIYIPRKDSERIVVCYPKALVNSYNGNDYRCHSFGNYMTDLDTTNYKYVRIHLFMYYRTSADPINVEENAEPNSNQNRMIIPTLDSDCQGEHGARSRLMKFGFVHFLYQIYASREDSLSDY